MDNSCRTGSCKKKLTEYRDLTSKLYGEIDCLESDIKDKEGFLQKVVKARNGFQEEVAVLKKKISGLVKENNDLSDKVEQLDEDTDTGVELLRNANAREMKLSDLVEEYKKHEKILAEKNNELTIENEATTSKFSLLKEKYRKCLKDNQEISASNYDEMEDLKKDILNLEKNVEQHTINTKNAKMNLAEVQQNHHNQAARIEALETENVELKKKNDDINDELSSKAQAFETNQTPLQSSANSLSDEIAEAGIFSCDHCDLIFLEKDELKGHKVAIHEAQFKKKSESKITNLEKVISEQKVRLTSSLLNLKTKEIKASQTCNCQHFCTTNNKKQNFLQANCKHFCRLNHQKYNFHQSKSDEILSKLVNNSSNLNANQVQDVGLGARRKRFSCNKCDEEFCKQGELKKHRKNEHKSKKEKIEKMGEVQ